jgi:hypothetical protein
MKVKVFIPGGIVILFAFMKLITSCTPDACIGETIAFVNVSFYKTGTSTPVKADSLTVFGIGMETNKLYNKTTNVTVIRLPLDASAETCGFVMKINNITDTLRFTYENYPHLVSKECGITFYHTLESSSWSGNVIDTIYIENANITTFNVENIRIFY